MNVEVKDINQVKKEIKIVIPKEKVTERFENAYKTFCKTVQIKGFRPGKAPLDIVKKTYKGEIIQQIFKDIINDTYYKAISDLNLLPVTLPDISPQELIEGKEFEYTATIELKPTLKDIKYTGLKLEKEKITISDEDLDKELEHLQENHSTSKTCEDPKKKIETGDIVIIDFEGFLKTGEPIKDGKAKDYQTEVGSKRLIEELETGIIGLKAHDEKNIDAKMPDTHPNPDLRNIDVTFKVKIKEIRIKDKPELNDDFAKTCGGLNTLNELKDKIREDLTKYKEQSVNYKLRQDIAAELTNINKFDVPDSLVLDHKERLIKDAKMRLSYMGKENIEKYIIEHDHELHQTASGSIKLYFLFEDIAHAEKIEINDADISAEFENISKTSLKSIDEIRTYYKKHNLLDDLKYQLKENKIYDLIINGSTVKEVEPKTEEEIDKKPKAAKSKKK